MTGGLGVGVTAGGVVMSIKLIINNTIWECWFESTTTEIHSEFTNITIPSRIETIFTNIEINLWN